MLLKAHMYTCAASAGFADSAWRGSVQTTQFHPNIMLPEFEPRWLAGQDVGDDGPGMARAFHSFIHFVRVVGPTWTIRPVV